MKREKAPAFLVKLKLKSESFLRPGENVPRLMVLQAINKDATLDKDQQEIVENSLRGFQGTTAPDGDLRILAIASYINTCH